MITPSIRLVAFEDRFPNFIFVAVPNERGRYVRTDRSVALVHCPACKAVPGEPCRRYRWGMNCGLDRDPPRPAEPFTYVAGTHHTRRSAYNTITGSRHVPVDDVIDPPSIPKPRFKLVKGRWRQVHVEAP